MPHGDVAVNRLVEILRSRIEARARFDDALRPRARDVSMTLSRLGAWLLVRSRRRSGTVPFCVARHRMSMAGQTDCRCSQRSCGVQRIRSSGTLSRCVTACSGDCRSLRISDVGSRTRPPAMTGWLAHRSAFESGGSLRAVRPRVPSRRFALEHRESRVGD
jgi:hypothetical protein